MNSFKVKIDYYVYDICPDRKCIHYDNCTLGETYHDKEYSPSFDSLEETKKMISEKTGYYEDYPWLFDDQLIIVEKETNISDNCIQITIYQEREYRSCDDLTISLDD